MHFMKKLSLGAAALALGAFAMPAMAEDAPAAAGSSVQKLESQAMAQMEADPHACCTGAGKAAMACGMCDPAAKAEVGKPAINFKLSDINGKPVMLSDYAGKIVVLNWVSNGCPFMVDLYKRNDMTNLTSKYKENKDVVFLYINSNASENAESVKGVNENYKIETTTLLDPTGVVGKQYDAKTTPHAYVIGKDGKLAYAGAYSNAPMGKLDGEGPEVNYIDAAVTSLIANEPVKVTTSKPWGCGVKYAPKS